jgi:hypothetical protein
MCGVCHEISNPSIAPSLYVAGFAGVAAGGKHYLQQLRNRVPKVLGRCAVTAENVPGDDA